MGFGNAVHHIDRAYLAAYVYLALFYETSTNLAIIVGGPNRPPSKRMLAQQRAEDAQRSQASRAAPGAGASQQEQQTWAQWMQSGIEARTKNLNIMEDSMNRLEENASGWAEDVDKFVSQQKRNLVMGAIKSKLR